MTLSQPIGSRSFFNAMAAECDLPQLQAEDAVAESEREVYVAVIAFYKALGRGTKLT